MLSLENKRTWNISRYPGIHQERPEDATKLLIQREHLPELVSCIKVRYESVRANLFSVHCKYTLQLKYVR
jgi:hypothetical protein